MNIEQKKWIDFTDSKVNSTLLQWWKTLDSTRGDRADLRRCTVTEEVFFSPAYHRLRHEMLQYGSVRNEPLSIVAGVLSHVRDNDGSASFAGQLARIPAGKEGSVMSEFRFRKFLSVREPDVLFREGIRAVRILDGSVNIPDLAQGLYWWNSNTRKRWAFSYYENIV
jgi:CRISPR system Cascade subunit CasB